MSVPNDIRLLDAITIEHGPIDLLSRFFLAADQFVRDRGIRLTIRHDMEAMAELNRAQSESGGWHALMPCFDPALSELSADNSFWIAGLNEAGDTVTAHSGRLYRWTDSSLADHAAELLHPDPAAAPPVSVDCPAARLVRGNVFFGGGAWIHPDYRRHGVATTAARIARAYAAASWGVEWFACFLKRELVDINYHAALGYPEADFTVWAPGSMWGDAELAVARQNALHLLAQLELFLAKRAGAGKSVARAA